MTEEVLSIDVLSLSGAIPDPHFGLPGPIAESHARLDRDVQRRAAGTTNRSSGQTKKPHKLFVSIFFVNACKACKLCNEGFSSFQLFYNDGGEKGDEVLYGTSDGKIGLVQVKGVSFR